MVEPHRIIANVEPATTVNLNNGNWYYNYDIQTETVVTSKEVEEYKEETQYNYIQIKLSEKPTYSLCVEALIREYVSQSQEFDLINAANKDILAGKTTSDNIAKYKDYLSKVEEIKKKVKESFS